MGEARRNCKPGGRRHSVQIERRPCPQRARGGCGSRSDASATAIASDGRARGARFAEVLRRAGLSGSDLERFVRWLEVALAVRAERRAPHKAPNDILTMIEGARDASDLEEAVWRAFLAAYFGRTSIAEGERDSAFDLLCAFAGRPYWTWSRVAAAPDAFKAWLEQRSTLIEQLTFGNHRKRRSKFTVASLWQVVESFFQAVARAGRSPAVWISTAPEALTDEDRFHELYGKVQAIRDFGRLGAFDFVELLSDLQIVRAEPRTCYLPGATGPLEGARRLWPGRPPRELDKLAAGLARDLGISPAVLEDALCNWQK